MRKRGDPAPNVTPALLQEFLRYDPEAGKLYWRPRGEKWFDSAARCAWWNRRFAGQEAFTSPGGGESSYRCGAVLGLGLLAHRAIWAVVHGEWPDQIDHINGDRADNRIVNLRNVTSDENHRNLARSRKNTSGRTGVCHDKRSGKWLAYICVNGVQKRIGDFVRKDDAIAARVEAEMKHGYHPNHGR